MAERRVGLFRFLISFCFVFACSHGFNNVFGRETTKKKKGTASLNRLKCNLSLFSLIFTFESCSMLSRSDGGSKKDVYIGLGAFVGAVIFFSVCSYCFAKKGPFGRPASQEEMVSNSGTSSHSNKTQTLAFFWTGFFFIQDPATCARIVQLYCRNEFPVIMNVEALLFLWVTELRKVNNKEPSQKFSEAQRNEQSF